MTSYHIPTTTLPSLAAKAAKAQRKRVLDAVRARRKIIYARFREHMKQYTPSEFEIA